MTAPLTDRRHRPLRDLRISVIDRCNFRCGYCMPADLFGPGHAFLPKQELLAFEEIHRVAKKGCRSISFVETPHVQGLPSFLSGHWDPMFAALSDHNMVLSLHIGAGFAVINSPKEAPVDHLMVLACQISAITAQENA